MRVRKTRLVQPVKPVFNAGKPKPYGKDRKEQGQKKKKPGYGKGLFVDYKA